MSSPPPILAFDIGGTKIAAGLVDGPVVVARRETPTDRLGGAAAWIDAAARLAKEWSGYRRVGAAVTGLVRDGVWRALNPDTLPVPNDYPLAETLRRRFGAPALARNDAQAAAWGEFRFGPASIGDMAFVTVSTGIGGGLIAGGRLLEGHAGLAGHIGVTPIDTPEGVRYLEEIASGSALARLARDQGGAAEVTAAATRGDPWALAMLDSVTAPLALALRRLQLEFDPDTIVVGGGLGLAPGYLDRLQRHLETVPALMRPTLRAATLGVDAGLIGVADLAATQLQEEDR